MASDKIDQLEKERKEAEARQRAEKEEREAKIKRQERLVRILVFGGFIFVICYNLAKTFSAKNETIIITQQPEKKLEKCEVELLARNACRKEVEELCSALGIKVSFQYNYQSLWQVCRNDMIYHVVASRISNSNLQPEHNDDYFSFRQVGTIVKQPKTSIQLVVKVKASLFRNKEINIQSVISMQ